MTKVLMVGPAKSGKTCLANFIMQSNQEGHTVLKEQGAYHPTAGTRILEFDINLTKRGSKNWDGQDSVNVELWDCSGDPKYESCWPAMCKDVDGVVIVYNPENPIMVDELENWYDWFVKKSGIQSDRCCCFAYNISGGDASKRQPIDKKVNQVFADASSIEKFTDAFQDLIGDIGKYK